MKNKFKLLTFSLNYLFWLYFQYFFQNFYTIYIILVWFYYGLINISEPGCWFSILIERPKRSKKILLSRTTQNGIFSMQQACNILGGGTGDWLTTKLFFSPTLLNNWFNLSFYLIIIPVENSLKTYICKQKHIYAKNERDFV